MNSIITTLLHHASRPKAFKHGVASVLLFPQPSSDDALPFIIRPELPCHFNLDSFSRLEDERGAVLHQNPRREGHLDGSVALTQGRNAYFQAQEAEDLVDLEDQALHLDHPCHPYHHAHPGRPAHPCRPYHHAHPGRPADLERAALYP